MSINSRLERFTILSFLLAAPVSASTETRAWVDTLERIAPGVVSIRVDSTRAFDTEWNASSQATGFVVDAERGLILTNRHVVTPGPVVAEAVFRNNEEVRLTPVYRDPVHDFGLFRYDPDDLRYIEPRALKLVPDAAGIGREIRVVGNDAGEQLSILAGTIARLDRQAPDYGRGKYNDFNTFYLQAASGTSGGSSGSPVINIDGEVVALNAGANNSAASSFFLPLDRIDRALRLIQDGQAVTRGTLKTVFLRKPYDELNRLGLSDEAERKARSTFPDQTGMLVVGQVIPGSPAAGELAVGDIIINVNGQLITEFVPLAAILDDKVGEAVLIELERGGERLEKRIVVSDLHAITPSEFIEFGDATVNELSYQQARHYNLPVAGIYVANPGYLLSRAAIPRGAVISEFGGRAVRTLDDLEAVLHTLATGSKTQLRYVTIDNPRSSVVRAFEMDRVWFPVRRCARDDSTGLWPCRDLSSSPLAKPAKAGSTRFTRYDDARVRAVAPSLVVVSFDLPYTVSGVAERHYYGTGLIVDAERGYVLVDRNTVPIAIGDVTVTFAGSLEVPARVEQLHPLHNLAIVAYDPASIGDTPVRSARFNTRPLVPGDTVLVVGMKADHQLTRQTSVVASVDPLVLPLSRTLRFRDTNIETVKLVNAPEDFDGVLVDSDGRVSSTWSSFVAPSAADSSPFNRGVLSELLVEFVDTVRQGLPFYSLEAELQYMPLFAARNLGIDEDWLDRLERANPQRRRVLSVTRLVAGSSAARLLRNGDIVLAIDGRVVTSYRELEQAVRKDKIRITVWRNGAERQFDVATAALAGRGIDRVVSWAGALLHNPHRAMAVQRGIEPYGVYVAFFSYGSPATRYGLFAGRRVVAVDDVPTPDLDAFVDIVTGKAESASLRIKTLSWNGTEDVITLKPDNQYWPAYEVRRTPGGWVRRALTAMPGAARLGS